MRLSALEQDVMTRLNSEAEEGLCLFVHDYLGAPAGAFVQGAFGEDWAKLYGYICLHLHLVSDADLMEYCE